MTIATKFVEWDISPLETLKDSFPYRMREKLNNGGTLTRNEKNDLYSHMFASGHGSPDIRHMGYRFDFRDVCKLYYIEQYGHIAKRYAPDKTSIRNQAIGRITRIVEIKP